MSVCISTKLLTPINFQNLLNICPSQPNRNIITYKYVVEASENVKIGILFNMLVLGLQIMHSRRQYDLLLSIKFI